MIDIRDWEGMKNSFHPKSLLKLVCDLKAAGVRFSPDVATKAIQFLGSEEVLNAIRGDKCSSGS